MAQRRLPHEKCDIHSSSMTNAARRLIGRTELATDVWRDHIWLSYAAVFHSARMGVGSWLRTIRSSSGEM